MTFVIAMFMFVMIVNLGAPVPDVSISQEGPFAGWTRAEIQAYREFARAMVADGRITEHGWRAVGADGNPVVDAILRALGIPGMQGAGLLWLWAAYAVAARAEPPVRLAFLRAIAAGHVAGASSWVTFGVRDPGAPTVWVTIWSVRW